MKAGQANELWYEAKLSVAVLAHLAQGGPFGRRGNLVVAIAKCPPMQIGCLTGRPNGPFAVPLSFPCC